MLFINQKPRQINKKRLTALVEKIVSQFDKVDKELDITYVDNETIKDLNIRYLQIDDYTDVISFNLEDELEDNLLGDIYISAEQAKLQAKEFGSDYLHELIRLTIHGVLHVLGYEDDTPEKKQNMHQEEDKWLNVYFSEEESKNIE